MEPQVFQIIHITSNPSTEPELQIRYNNGLIYNISKDEIYNKLMTKNLDTIVKISWNNNRRRFIGRIIKGEDIYPEIIAKYNINSNDYYIMIENFSFNQYRNPLKYKRLYCKLEDNWLIEIIDIYKIQQNLI
jgi:hypothetical protein